MAGPSYTPLGESHGSPNLGHDGDLTLEQRQTLLASPTGTPRIGDMDLGRMSFFDQSGRRSATPTFSRADSPGYSQAFSSAQSYAPMSHDMHRPPTPGTPASLSAPDMLRSPSSRPGFTSTYSDRPSTRLSVASSHMLNTSDYGSQHHLMRYADSGSFPMHEYEKEGQSRATTPGGGPRYMPVGAVGEKYGQPKKRKPMSTRKKWAVFAGVVVGLILLAIAIAIALVATHDKTKGGATVPGTGPHGEVLTSGTNGSSIRMENGTTFTYINNFGGEWHSNLNDDGARAQSYTPSIGEAWDYASNPILGVNLGGWLVIEPFIVPSLFEPYENNSQKTYVVDEYTLMNQWNAEGGQAAKMKNLQQHYDTFITEYDFMLIAAAGLNWVRIPLGYWAISTMPGEPFVQGMSWQYFLKAVQWARKYGLRIKLDLHAIPGSQNGYNHGGRLGVFNFLNSPSGMVSAERSLDIIRVIAEFVAQPEVVKIVPIFGILNEPNLPVGIGMDNLRRFYVEAYSLIRNITGTGAGNGPFMSYHDGFMGLQSWTGFMQGGDRVAWDLHPYVCFVPPFGTREDLISSACNGFASNTENGLANFGLTFAGEWSLASNDCGLYLNGPFQGVRYDGSWASGQFQSEGSCEPFDDWQSYNASTKQTMYQGALAQMASFRNFFFWTWKVGDSLRTGGPVNPNWSYLLGLQQGWMPKDPYHESQNACGNLQKQGNSAITKTSLNWASTFANYQTGSASTYSPNVVSYSWPPPFITLSGTSASTFAGSVLPTYTPTGTVLVPPTPTYSLTLTNEAQPSLDPWIKGGRQTPAFTPVAGCSYFDSIWNNATTAQPGWPCGGAGSSSRRRWLMSDLDLGDVGMWERDIAKPAVTAAP